MQLDVNVGGIQGTVTFTKGGGMKEVALDANGYAKGVTGGAVTLAKDALYMVVTM